MHTIREITRLATMFAGLIAPQLRLDFVSASSRLCLSYVSALHQVRLTYASTTPWLRSPASIVARHAKTRAQARNILLFFSNSSTCLVFSFLWIGENLYCLEKIGESSTVKIECCNTLVASSASSGIWNLSALFLINFFTCSYSSSSLENWKWNANQ